MDTKEEKPIEVRCPTCKEMREPQFNETTHRYVCPICSGPLDTQVWIEKKKRGSGPDKTWRNRRE